MTSPTSSPLTLGYRFASKGLDPARASPAIPVVAVLLYVLYCALAYVVTFDVLVVRLRTLLASSAAVDAVAVAAKLGYVFVGMPMLYRHITQAEDGADHAPALDACLLFWRPTMPLQSLYGLCKPPPPVLEKPPIEYQAMTECKVCLEFYTAEKLAAYCDTCTTPCCIACFNNYLEHRLTSNETLCCPGCKNHLSPTLLTSSAVSFDTREACAAHCLTQDEQRTCPRCHKPARKGSLRKRRVICDACKATSCADCGKDYHLLPTCRDKAFERYCRETGVKRCPGCSRLVQKADDACDHVTCVKCLYAFEWPTVLSYDQTKP
ncbi:hypothetical protein SPRG_03412 [Saprolegnia parasitica CBS 223.65]|uniref:RING-type domain-containing protein n=1 Tax=Saprolegnia parasitica (strain CBS 223.65) TaxID=695850 RepID=A0A067CSJ9_SAPPC|nr:hypothetical protein SPRG_03412 [Saprolegnia parasitica CBS 223.65]KDO32195.1 hypothetical protein SPRG_03412 [Saprolegnia parasitica CBS 223.65]|eukprot:XP_012197375.1 hypothetical protein SPRG_03412 [Saprolegnia parasitica CBS 223.65]